VFEAVSAEVAALIAADGSALMRYEAEGTVTAVSGWTTEGGFGYLGIRYPLEGTVSGLIFETGAPARMDNYAEAPGEAAEAARELGCRSSVAAKHSRASRVQVEVEVRDRSLCIAVADDGVGGADATRGSGLLGLKDRVEAIGGTISIESREGAGTSLTAVLPLANSTN
jgi:Histidine kinase-, DNA gyrase B-, and HSP90-like ATPase